MSLLVQTLKVVDQLPVGQPQLLPDIVKEKMNIYFTSAQHA